MISVRAQNIQNVGCTTFTNASALTRTWAGHSQPCYLLAGSSLCPEASASLGACRLTSALALTRLWRRPSEPCWLPRWRPAVLTMASVSSSSWGVSQASSLCRPQWQQVGDPLLEVCSHACLTGSCWGPCLAQQAMQALTAAGGCLPRPMACTCNPEHILSTCYPGAGLLMAAKQWTVKALPSL